MIESPLAVRNIGQIVTVDGLDAIVIGMSDLARSFAHASDPGHPDVQRAVDAVIAAAAANRPLAAGYNLHDWDQAAALRQKGVRWFTIHARGMLRRANEHLRTLLGT
jgi:2-keto-3-deoxy-L-rhamnonate aldolase RhmA